MRTDKAPYGNTIRRALAQDIIDFYRATVPEYEDYPDEVVLKDWMTVHWAWLKDYPDEA